MKRLGVVTVGFSSVLVTLLLGWPSTLRAQQPVQRPTPFVSDSLEIPPLTTREAAARADRIVLLKSKKVEVRQDVRGNIFTYTTFELLDTIKGTQNGNGVTLRLLGGRIGDVEVSSPLTRTFTPGDKFVLFLGKDNRDGYPTIIPQAIFAVRTTRGVDVNEPAPTGLPLFHAKGNRPYGPRAGTIPLEDLLFSLRAQ